MPQFAFLDVLLGSESVLTPAESLHQRLLALNPDEATENAEEYLEKHSLEEFYNDVGIPALVSIERDRARGAIDEDRRSLVFDSIITLIDNLSEVEDKPADVTAIGEAKATTQIDRFPKGSPRPGVNDGRVLCIGARGNLDDAAATILARLIERRGGGAQPLSWIDATPTNLPLLDIEGTKTVCLVYLNENSLAHARYLSRRLRHRMPSSSILVALLSLPTDESSRLSAQEATKADAISTSLVDTLDQISAAWRGFEHPASGTERGIGGQHPPVPNTIPRELTAISQ